MRIGRLLRWGFLALFSAGLWSCTTSSLKEEPAKGAFAFVNVHVIPMNQDTLLLNQTVVVDNGQITKVAPVGTVTLAEDVHKIDGQGKYLMPGLVDLATYGLEADELLMHVANGVTSVMHLRGTNLHQEWNEQILRGEMLGPTMYVTGNIVDGPIMLQGGGYHRIESSEEAREVVDLHAQHNIDWLRVGFSLSPEHYATLMDAAAQRGVEVVGDVPVDVGLEGVEHTVVVGLDVVVAALLDEKVPVFENMNGGVYPQGAVPAAAYAHIDETRLEAVIAQVKAKELRIMPALTSFQKNYLTTVERQAMRFSDPRVGYVRPYTRSFWARKDANDVSEAEVALAQEAHALRLQLTKALHDADVSLLLGTMALTPYVLSGYDALEEIARFVEAGIPPFEALHIATFHGAAALGKQDSFGTVAVGMDADLVVLNSNPLDDVRHLEDRAGVMVRGRWFPQTQLEQALANLTSFYAKEDRFMGTLEGEGLDAARQAYRDAQRTDPAPEVVRHTRLMYRVYALRFQRKYDEALALLDFALELFPDEWYVYETQGEVYRMMGDTTRALASYEQSLEKWSRNEEVRDAIRSLQRSSPHDDRE